MNILMDECKLLLESGFGIGVLCFIRVEEVSGSIPGSPHLHFVREKVAASRRKTAKYCTSSFFSSITVHRTSTVELNKRSTIR
jgi:hypothetical protein